MKWVDLSLLVKIALHSAVPFVVRSRDRESREELAEWARGRRPIHFSKSVDQILGRHVPPIHGLNITSRSPRIGTDLRISSKPNPRTWIEEHKSSGFRRIWGRSEMENYLERVDLLTKTLGFWDLFALWKIQKSLGKKNLSEPGFEPGTSSVWD